MAAGSPWRSITVVVDTQQKSHPALDKAAALAARCGAGLTLLNTFVLPQPMADVARISARSLINAALRERRQQLEKLADPLRRRKLRVKCLVEWDYPQSEAVVRHVLANRPDMVVAETTRHNRFARWILANTDWELIRTCPCPLWLVRGGRPSRNLDLLVAVDPAHGLANRTRLDVRLMEAAARFVDCMGGTVSMVHVDNPRATQIDAVERLATRHGVAPDHRHVIPGEVTRVLPKLVGKLQPDVLLMGAVSRSRVGEPFIGTTAERLIDRVTCDVFVVKPAGFKSPVTRRKPRIPA